MTASSQPPPTHPPPPPTQSTSSGSVSGVGAGISSGSGSTIDFTNLADPESSSRAASQALRNTLSIPSLPSFIAPGQTTSGLGSANSSTGPTFPSSSRDRMSRRESGSVGARFAPEDSADGIFQEAKMDLSTLPREYLESFPYPAFVLVAPIPPPPEHDEGDDLPIPPQDHHLPFTRSSHPSTQPFEPVWTSEKWRNLTQGRTLLDCISIDGARALGDWISGARVVRGKDRRHVGLALSGPVASRTRSHFEPPAGLPIPTGLALPPAITATGLDEATAPEGFWEPENPYEDRVSLSDSASDGAATGIEGWEPHHPGPMSVTIELVDPVQVTLELTKTTMPIYQYCRTGARTKMATHTYIVITTIPRGPMAMKEGPVLPILPTPASLSMSEPPSDPAVVIDPIHLSHGALRTTILASPASPPKTMAPPLPIGATLDTQSAAAVNITPTDEIMALDMPHGSTGQSRPIFFNRDGTVSRPRGFGNKGLDNNGRSLDVHELLRDFEWSTTSLGPQESWPQSLKTIVSLIMHYPHPCCLWWGKDLTLIYNEAYSETIHKHPDIFGMSGPTAWSEIWAAIGPLSELVLSGTPVSKEDDFLLFKQLPHQGTGTFEVYHSWMWVPIIQEDGTFGGLWNATIETTKKVLAERRLATVREMGERTSIARTIREFDGAVVEILAANARDVPFAALYHVEVPTSDKRHNPPNRPGQVTQTASNNVPKSDLNGPVEVTLNLAGSVGVPEGHASTPSSLTVTLNSRQRESRSGLSHITGSPTMSIVSTVSGAPQRSFTPLSSDEDMRSTVESWPFKEALQSRRLVLVEDCSNLIEGFGIRVWDELPNAAVVVPIANDSDEGIPSAVIVIGLSIRRPFDEEYESFLHVLRLQLASGVAAVRSYEAERQRIDELAALDRAKSMLFSNVSHELRTPLTLVAGPLDDMLRETPEGPKKEMLVMARRNVRRLTRLVSTLMDVSRLEAGRLKGSFRQVNLGVMTRDLAALFRGAIERAKLRYIVEADLSPKDIYVDTEHWEKILFNLIGDPTEAILSVKDSGVGIPGSDIDLVGERFHRVASVSRSHEGTGIGLALVKELIKLHGGILEIESLTASESFDGSHGSVFRVRIPIGSNHLPRDAIEIITSTTTAQIQNTNYGQGIVDEAMQWNRDREGSSVDSASDSGVTSGDSSGQSSRGLDPSTLYFKKEDVIMLVDDSFDTRRYMKSIFAPFCSIIEARDGQEALDYCKKPGNQLPDLVITDVMMPNLDGFGLLSALKSDKRLAMIPVVMLTARGGDEYKIEGLLAGADDYQAKPFNARELIARAHMQIQLGKRRRMLEEAFDERTAEMRLLSEYSPFAIFRATNEGDITYANPAWYEIAGFPAGEPVVDWEPYVADHSRESVLDFWSRCLNGDNVLTEGEWQNANGRWVTGKVIRLDLAAPGLRGVLGVLMDITERKLNEESQRLRVVEAEQRRLEAEEAKRQQELLIDITSHEIRNPISSLMQMSPPHNASGRLSVLTPLHCSSLVKTNLLALQEQLEMAIRTGGGFFPTQQLLTTINEDLEALESIYQCGLSQERISNDVLSLGRIQLDMLQMFDVETDLRQEAQKVISIFQNEARMKRIALSLKLGESIERLGLHAIKTDPVRLGQVVTNLLSNGIRFTSTSSIRRIELRFDLSFEPPADSSCLMPRLPNPPAPGTLKDDMPVYLYVAVTDTGPGLTPKELELLFQRFSQVSPKTHTVFGGSGLGLFVCRKITELMGGRIEVTSEHGKGSTFRFFIEARTCQTSKRPASIDDVEMAEARPPIKRRHTATKMGFAGPGPKPHVLIVEDNLINQTVLARQLKHVGLTCEVASNGLEALEKVRRVSSLTQPPQGQPFDCILMDLEMPVMDGLTALRHIREEEAAGTLALNLVIALTGNARQGQIDEAKAAGMDEVVIKPYRLDDLLHKIEEMMRIRATAAAAAQALAPPPLERLPSSDSVEMNEA